jgi:uncharacterized protein (TIGR01777 family)
MKVVIAGGTGFLGRPLAEALLQDGHDVAILTRNRQSEQPRPGTARARFVTWTPDGDAGTWQAEVDGAGAVVNLAGESIAARRWTPSQKRRIVQSRVLATRSLRRAMSLASTPPAVFVSGSAVGYYGPRADGIATEDAAAGSDFLAGVCRQWEAEAAADLPRDTRLACIRTGLVLERDGGALPKMLRPFWFGVGGPVGSGRQYWPWIHREDWIELVRWVIRTPAASGPFNASAPNPVPNARFAQALGRALHRPALLSTPGFGLKLLLGEMAEGLLLSGQRAVPAKAERLGFRFRFQHLEEALRALFDQKSDPEATKRTKNI